MSKKHSNQKKMFWTKVIFVICAIFTYCESAPFVKSLKKCGFGDSECQQELYKNILEEIADTGIPDLDIPPVDPYPIKDRDIIVLGLIKMAMPDGAAKGFKTCRSTSHKIDTDKLTHSIELVCERFTIEGQYNIQTTPTLDVLIGGIKIHGEGKAKVDLENVQLNLEVPFEIKKLDDGEPHVVLDADTITYTYKVLDKATIAADSLYIGSQEVSAVTVNIFNENWNFITNSFAKPMFDKGVEVFIGYVNKFFANVPMKDFITDDVSAYVTA